MTATPATPVAETALDLLEKALTWEGRLNEAAQLAMQRGSNADSLNIRNGVSVEMRLARQALARLRAPSESSESEAVDRIALHNEGYTAQERGVPATSNPHPRGTISRDLWRLGWIEAGEPVDTTEGGA